MPENQTEYDVARGGVQRVHHHGPGRCWEWGRATGKRTLAVHVSAGRPVWWKPNVGRKRYAGITEWRAGWLLFAVQVAHRAHVAVPPEQKPSTESTTQT